jgi:putative transposase
MERPRNPLERFYGRCDLHFVTFSCFRRRPYLGTIEARNCFVRILDKIRCRHDFVLIGYVVMPEHVHLLIGEPSTGNPSEVLQVLKQNVSRALQSRYWQELRGAACGDARAASAFWQRRFYDFNVWSEQKLREKLVYMHENPVKRNLVSHPEDWPWSSWSHYAKGGEGLIAIDAARDRVKRRENPHP